LPRKAKVAMYAAKPVVFATLGNLTLNVSYVAPALAFQAVRQSADGSMLRWSRLPLGWRRAVCECRQFLLCRLKGGRFEGSLKDAMGSARLVSMATSSRLHTSGLTPQSTTRS